MDAILRALRQAQMAVYVVLCMACAVFGTRLKWMTHDTSSEEYDRRKYVAGIWLAVGAGLVIGLIGHGVHVNSSLLMGMSIIAGYAGGRKFFGLDAVAYEKTHREPRRWRHCEESV